MIKFDVHCFAIITVLVYELFKHPLFMCVFVQGEESPKPNDVNSCE